MYALLWMLPVTLLLVLGAVLFFLWSVRSGQYEDLDGAAWRILRDEPHTPPPPRQRRD